MRTLLFTATILTLPLNAAESDYVEPQFPIQVELDSSYAYGLRSPVGADDPVTLSIVTVAEEPTTRSLPVPGLADRALRSNWIPWSVRDGQLHYVSVVVHPPMPGYITGLASIPLTDLPREVFPPSAMRFGPPKEIRCGIGGFSKRWREADEHGSNMHFDMQTIEQHLYRVYYKHDGLLETWDHDVRAEQIADRSIRKVSSIACNASGAFRVFDNRGMQYLLDQRGTLFVVQDTGLKKIGDFKELSSTQQRAGTLVFVEDIATPFVALLRVNGDEFRALEYTIKDEHFKNPMLEGDLTAPQKKAIQLLLNPDSPPPPATRPAE